MGDIFLIFFFLKKKKKKKKKKKDFIHFEIFSLGDSLHDVSNPIFWKEFEKYFKTLFADSFTQYPKH